MNKGLYWSLHAIGYLALTAIALAYFSTGHW
jgi:hypothetical protein